MAQLVTGLVRFGMRVFLFLSSVFVLLSLNYADVPLHKLLKISTQQNGNPKIRSTPAASNTGSPPDQLSSQPSKSDGLRDQPMKTSPNELRNEADTENTDSGRSSIGNPEINHSEDKNRRDQDYLDSMEQPVDRPMEQPIDSVLVRSFHPLEQFNSDLDTVPFIQLNFKEYEGALREFKMFDDAFIYPSHPPRRSLDAEPTSSNRGLSIGLAILLAFLSAVFSGLTLGLMVIDVVQLQILIQTAEKQPDCPIARREAKRAKRIYSLRKDGNFLLVTLLISNVSVNSAFSIIASDLTSGLVGFLMSTSIITILGEIIPQAICTRHGLVVGYYLYPLVCLTEIVLYIVVKPIAMVLDFFLGQ